MGHRTVKINAVPDEENKQYFDQMSCLPEVPLSQDEEANSRTIVAFVRSEVADDETRSRQSQKEQDLQVHLHRAGLAANGFVDRLKLPQEIATAIVTAARCHDLGKNRKVWQVGIGNREYPKKVLAKSDHKRRIIGLEGYRHEFGSLLDLPAQLDAGVDSELVLHLIATHHGRARPHFPGKEVFDPIRSEADAENMAATVPRRFARLQRKYGRWGLAYLESLLRAADWAASANPSSFLEDRS